MNLKQENYTEIIVILCHSILISVSEKRLHWRRNALLNIFLFLKIATFFISLYFMEPVFVERFCFYRGFARQPCCMTGTIDYFSYGRKCSVICKTFSLMLPCKTSIVRFSVLMFEGPSVICIDLVCVCAFKVFILSVQYKSTPIRT